MLRKNQKPDEQNVIKVADQIADYLRESGYVADTIEGIVQWWLPRQRNLPDGSVLYFAKNQ